MMSLLKYFRSRKSNDESFPSPAGSLSAVIPSTAIVAANPSLEKELKRSVKASYLILTPAQ